MSINSYIEALSALKRGRPNQASRKVGNNTYLEEDAIGECIHLRLHRTRILSWYADGRITVQAGGWQTNTTRDRLNSFMPEGFWISSRKVTFWLETGRYDRREWTINRVRSDEFVTFDDRLDLKQWGNLLSEQHVYDRNRERANEVQRPIVLAARRAERKAAKAEAEFAEAALDALFAADEAAAAAARSEWVSQ